MFLERDFEVKLVSELQNCSYLVEKLRRNHPPGRGEKQCIPRIIAIILKCTCNLALIALVLASHITASIPHFIVNTYMGFNLSLWCLIPCGLGKSNTSNRSLKIDIYGANFKCTLDLSYS